jgi:GH25 family lysozyme M1 (1,4-beta-N-acetylmuramidase)
MTSTNATELIPVDEEELQRLAEHFGPTSAEAQVLAQLAIQRGQDLQVFAFRVGDQYVTGPMPQASAQASTPDPFEEAVRKAEEKGCPNLS